MTDPKIKFWPKSGKVHFQSYHELSDMTRTEALELAINLLHAIQMSGDMSHVPSDLFSTLEGWQKEIGT